MDLIILEGIVFIGSVYIMKVTILDLVPRFKGEEIIDAIDRTSNLAKFADEKGYNRIWIAEHHNSKAVMGAATDLIIQNILNQTKNIRVGAGGVMLPNHTTFQVAERYGTLEALYPNRIDLGIGRAPGTDLETAKLIYRNIYLESSFKNAIKELLDYFEGDNDSILPSPYPGTGSKVGIYILGSSCISSRIAAEFGLPYAFAGHFSPDKIQKSIDFYRDNFKPSKYLDEPYVMLAFSSYIADSIKEANELNNQGKQVFLQILNQNNEEFYKIDPDFESKLTSIEKFMIKSSRGLTISGDKESARDQIEKIVNKYRPDELIVTTYIQDEEKLLKNYDILFDLINS